METTTVLEVELSEHEAQRGLCSLGNAALLPNLL